jgi:hypothetical protein
LKHKIKELENENNKLKQDYKHIHTDARAKEKLEAKLTASQEEVKLLIDNKYILSHQFSIIVSNCRMKS